jgi:hypothetical protein
LTGQAYSYAGDDPVNNTDPLGLSKCGHAHGIFDVAGSLVDCASKGDVGGAISTAAQAGTRTAATAINYSPFGTAAQAASSVTGLTLGGCISGSITGFSANGVASVCYYATPSGDGGLTASLGGGTGLGWGADLTLGPSISNAQHVSDLGGWFGYTGGSAGEDIVGSGSLSYGVNSCGNTIFDGYAGAGEDSGFNFGRPLGIPGLPFSAGTGASYTWTYQGW